MKQLFLPEDYTSVLDVWQTEHAIKFIKDTFQLALGCVCSSALPRRLWDKISRNTVVKLLVFTLLLVLCVCYAVAATNATALYANF